MKKKCMVFVLALIAVIPFTQAVAQKNGAHVPTPSEFVNFELGADRKLADYRQIAAYFKALQAASDRVQVHVLGKTTLGEEMIMGVISNAENLHNQASSQENARNLADPSTI